MTAPPITEIAADGTTRTISRALANETPIAIELNGIGYAVLMASAADLRDLTLGFCITEGLANSPAAIQNMQISETDKGWIVRANIQGAGRDLLAQRARTRVSEGSCGLCGMENLEAISKPLPAVPAHALLTSAAIFRALADLSNHQPENTATGGMHCAAYCDADGQILLAREDAGRHNALDKLIGAAALAEVSLANGFILTSSRCSYEIVEKSVKSGARRLVTISAPSDLAVARAQSAGLSLFALARADSVLDFTATKSHTQP